MNNMRIKERLINHGLIKLMLLVLVMLTPFTAWAQTFSGGTGTSNDPYIIKTTDDLTYLAGHVNDGSLNTDGMYFKMDDSQMYIDCANFHLFAPIGTFTHPFKGTFDGVSTNMYIGDLNYTLPSTGTYNGLFGVIDGGTVKNLKLARCTFSGGNEVGAIVGYLKSGTIDNCQVATCTLLSFNDVHNVTVGGVAGKLENGTISNCSVFATSITGSTTYSLETGYSNAGGIVGFIDCPSGTVSINSNTVAKGNGSTSMTILSSHAKPWLLCSGGIVGYCTSTNADIQISGNSVKDNTAIKGVNSSTNVFDYFFVGAIVGQAESATFQNNYYDYNVTTSTQSGTDPEVVLSEYSHRGTGAVQRDGATHLP